MALEAHLAAGWTFFVICLLASFIFSGFYVTWLRSVRAGESSLGTNVIVGFCLSITIISAALVPVDVFVVSSMKYANGTYEEWAQDPVERQATVMKMQVAYYTLFSIILALCFLVIPMTFFFHATSPLADDEDEQEEETTGQRLCRALKYTSASLILLIILVLLGIFLPFESSQTWQGDLTDYAMKSWAIFKVNEGFEMIVFLMNVISVVGLGLLILYTGIGLTSLPCQLIKGTNQVSSTLTQLRGLIETTTNRLQDLQGREDGLNSFEREESARLEGELTDYNRQLSELQESAQGCWWTCYRLFRPFQAVLGIVFSLLGTLVFAALLLNNIDKAIHSSARQGYILKNGTLPNPMDITLVELQRVFPLDYLLYIFMVIFFVVTTISGLQGIGIRFMWLPLYAIRPHRTKPQGLALMALSLLLILVASNVLFFTIAPDYTTFGSQRFVHFNPETNTSTVLQCDDSHAPPSECTMTMIATFLLAFHTKAWIFGAFYYWLTWIFLFVLLGGFCVSIVRCCKRPSLVPEVSNEEEELLNED